MAMKFLRQTHMNTCWLLIVIIVFLVIVAVATLPKERFESIGATTAAPVGANTLVLSDVYGQSGQEKLTVATDIGDVDTITLKTTPQSKTYNIKGDVSNIFIKFMNGQSSNLSMKALLYNGVDLLPSNPDKVIYMKNDKLNVGEYIYQFNSNNKSPMVIIHNEEEMTSSD